MGPWHFRNTCEYRQETLVFLKKWNPGGIPQFDIVGILRQI